MNHNGNKPIEQEYRTSQVYKTLTGTGNPTAEKIAQGLGRAAAGIDAAIQAAAQGYEAAKSAPQGQPPPQRPVGGPGPYNTGRGPAPAGGTYRYRPGQPTVQPPPVRPMGQTVQPPPQRVQPPQPGRPGGPGPVAPQYTAHRPTVQTRPPEGVTPAPPPQMPPMKVVRRGSAAKYYITGVAALLYAMNIQMMSVPQWVAFAAVMMLIFLISGGIFKGKKELVPVAPEKPQPKPQPEEKKEPEPEKKSATGDPEVDKLIDEGHNMIKKLRAANDAIPDEALSADIDRMERASADIFNYIASHPEKAQQIRKFMNYYLPTTLKLLNSYERLSKQSVKGENITSTMFNIAGMMHTVADAFEKQLDSLFTDEAMDISADITVFETMLKQEGFVEEKKNGI